jgi:hypothetical protein
MGAKAAPAPEVPLRLDHAWLWALDSLVPRLIMIALVILAAAIIYVLARRVLNRLQRQLTARSQTGPDALRRRALRALTIVSLLRSIARWVILLLTLL